ncbi:hypothetical protein GSI_08208 [Ganoderma sinense ZZ0214-1]|uniref:Uncharacterized protein n=1 Tax=Ganoderma sinense ZZ0214-1 TaxID=1077348 RepID=A0A2G8S716_9APHY|nr:hypothetical protein GSI_08208 [Ganoderma sinense ZZ0214-1]
MDRQRIPARHLRIPWMFYELETNRGTEVHRKGEAWKIWVATAQVRQREEGPVALHRLRSTTPCYYSPQEVNTALICHESVVSLEVLVTLTAPHGHPRHCHRYSAEPTSEDARGKNTRPYDGLVLEVGQEKKN